MVTTRKVGLLQMWTSYNLIIPPQRPRILLHLQDFRSLEMPVRIDIDLHQIQIIQIYLRSNNLISPFLSCHWPGNQFAKRMHDSGSASSNLEMRLRAYILL